LVGIPKTGRTLIQASVTLTISPSNSLPRKRVFAAGAASNAYQVSRAFQPILRSNLRQMSVGVSELYSFP
jgi:hypothetical protein